MQCDYFDAGLCRSCSLMGTPYQVQLESKQAHVEQLFSGYTKLQWMEPASSDEAAFRNKAKMVVSGPVDRPRLGILDRAGHGIDLSECGLYPDSILKCMPVLRRFITDHSLTPYDVRARRGELKSVLVTVSPDGEAMIRFVLRSKKLVVPLRRALPELLEGLPHVRVVSANILREHKAVVEGPEEIPLTDQQLLPMQLNGIRLYLRPQGFFQTNSRIAGGMYNQAADWAASKEPGSLWDLFCGVGGFALHTAQRLGKAAKVVGIEINDQAIAAARESAAEANLKHAVFVDGDASEFAIGSSEGPEMLVVNPPRRGIGAEMARWIESSDIETVMYSSCNSRSLAADLDMMTSFRPQVGRMFDMFPQTNHYETMVLLERSR
ncbi:methyltransferase domain-containing protein [Rothia uropygialis]|uniref:methyltransferase domain-containing protein n=1 Tax=Kocuria sp. 36 TaxID=1415402 RepID=UPI00101B9D7D|nr:methyltransferase domain-containing protein [Kocuria sp. 36]